MKTQIKIIKKPKLNRDVGNNNNNTNAYALLKKKKKKLVLFLLCVLRYVVTECEKKKRTQHQKLTSYPTIIKQ